MPQQRKLRAGSAEKSRSVGHRGHVAGSHQRQWIIDHFWVALRGSEILRVQFNTQHIFLVKNTPAVQLKYKVWPRDINIRRNMSTSEWMDVTTVLSSRNIRVSLEGPADVEVPEGNEALLADMEGQLKAQVSASIRRAVCAGIDGRM